jgi:hypothetical protein
MPTWTRPITVAVAVAAGLVACEGGGAGSDHARMDALTTRVEQLEKQLAAADKSTEGIDRLRNDAASLDRRVSVLETNVRELAARPTTGGVAIPVPPVPSTVAGSRPAGVPAPQLRERPLTGDRRMDRRTQLRALSDEFRAKVAELRSQPQADQQQSAQELLQWYREQRRAILRGGGRTDQPPGEPAQ